MYSNIAEQRLYEKVGTYKKLSEIKKRNKFYYKDSKKERMICEGSFTERKSAYGRLYIYRT